MIDEYWTFRFFGYNSDSLKPKSNKKVIAVCDECGVYRALYFSAYRDLCRKCAVGTLEHRERLRKLATGRHHTEKTKRKISKNGVGMRGKHHSEKTKKRISEVQKGKKLSDEHKRNISIGLKNLDKDVGRRISIANKGKKRNKEQKKRISNAKKGNKNPMWTGGKVENVCKQCDTIFEVDTHRSDEARFCSNRCKGLYFSGENNCWFGKTHTEETRRKISAAHQHIAYDEWEAFVCKLPYCPNFNKACRESNREKYDRRCFICGLQELENVDKNGKSRRLSVHHVDMDKNQGCNGVRWKLIPVCMSHHNHSKLWESRIVYLLAHVWCS